MTSKIDLIVSIVKAANPARRKAAPKTKKPSAKALAIQEFVKNSDFGCKKRSVLNLMEILIGEKFVSEDTHEDLVNGRIVRVISSDETGHCFGHGTLVVCSMVYDEDGGAHFMSVDHDEDNDPQVMNAPEYEVATKKEVEAFIAQVKAMTDNDQQKRLLTFLL